MEFIGLLFVLLFLVLIVGSIFGFVAMSKVGKLETDVRKLQNIINGLQQTDRSPTTLKPPIPLPPQIKPAHEAQPKPTTPDNGFAKPTPPVPVAKTQSAPTVKAPKPRKEKRKWEEEFGARWTVWVGGIALALGAVFLLRYAAEAGVFTPGMRIGLAGLLGIGALGTGEFLRRLNPGDAKLPEIAKSTVDNAYIPGVLTAVGIFTLLGAVYAAYGIYGLIGPTLSFALLGLVSLAGLALGLIHGPRMSALGLLAGLVTPLLVHTGTPQYVVLFIYLALVGGAAIALAYVRTWPWLILSSVGGLLAWSVLTVEDVSGKAFLAWAAFMSFIYGVTLFLYLKSHAASDEKTPSHIAYVPLLVINTLIAAIVWLSAGINAFQSPAFIFAISVAVVFMGVGWRAKTIAIKILLGGALSGVLLYGLASTRADIFTLLAWGVPSMMLFLGLGTLALRKTSEKLETLYWPSAVPAIPLLTFASWPFANTLLSDSATGGIMAAFSVICVALAVLYDHAKRPWAVHTHLIAAALSYALFIALYFTGMPVSLGLMCGIVLTLLLSRRLNSECLAFIALGFGSLLAVHVLFLELPTEGRVSAQIFPNQLWIYLALPAALCAGAGLWLGRRERTLGTEGLKALGLAFAALFAVFQIRHLMNGGDLFAYTLKFDELALQILIGLCFTLGGTLISQKGPREILALQDQLIPNLAMLISGLTLAVFTLGVCLLENPLFTNDVYIRGHTVVNSLTLAYLLPAILLGAIAWLSQSRRPALYVRIAAGLSLLAVLLFLTTQVRFMFTGADISLRTSTPKGLELYMISAVWLALGVVLLFAGLKSKRRDLRLASAVVIILTVLKAFLVDMAGLEGALRAMAFVVLGVILIVVGRAYQRLLFSGQAEKPS